MSELPTSEDLVSIDRQTLDQLYRIDRSARAFVNAVSSSSKPEQKRCFDALCNALFNGVPND